MINFWLNFLLTSFFEILWWLAVPSLTSNLTAFFVFVVEPKNSYKKESNVIIHVERIVILKILFADTRQAIGTLNLLANIIF